MAIIFSLPWALLMWSYVISFLKLLLLPHYGPVRPDRMVTFSVALLLFCFVISNLWTQVFVGLTSFPLFALTLWCLWMCWDSRSGSDGRTVPAQLEFLFNAFESLRIRTAFPARSEATLASGDGSSRHSPHSSRGDVSGV